jgi:hypothetical protein
MSRPRPATAACSRCSASTAAPRSTNAVAEGLAGYRGMGPVRIGNQAYRQVQHDVYGSAILAATHIFFDQRLTRRGDEALFHRSKPSANAPAKNFDQPDAGSGNCAAAPACTPFPR